MSSEPATTERDADHVQSLARGLTVLRAFDADHRALTLSDVSRLTGLTRATSRRLLLTFEQLGYMRCDGRRFELTPRVLDLGYAYVSSLHLSDLALPFMGELSDRVQESVSVSVLDGHEIVYVARVPARRIMTMALALGSRLPALITSMGRVLVANLDDDEREHVLNSSHLTPRTHNTVTDPVRLRALLGDVRKQGYAIVDQELEDGVRSVAAPLRDRNGRAIAALNVGANAGRVSLKELRRDILPLLLDSSCRISEQLAKR